MYSTHLLPLLPLLYTLTTTTVAAPISDKEDVYATAACTSYTIINTRGTSEIQGPSSAFRTMNSAITSQLSGGKQYNTVYPASFSQDSSQGTTDIVNKVTTTLASNPNECFILEGYSQGAAASVNAMAKLTGAAFDAVKGVFLVGNPMHKSGLSCNVDNKGGSTTKNVNGMSAALGGGVPQNWLAKTMDVCIYVSFSFFSFLSRGYPCY